MFDTANQTESLANFTNNRVNMISPIHTLVDCNTQVLITVNLLEGRLINLDRDFSVLKFP